MGARPAGPGRAGGLVADVGGLPGGQRSGAPPTAGGAPHRTAVARGQHRVSTPTGRGTGNPRRSRSAVTSTSRPAARWRPAGRRPVDRARARRAGSAVGGRPVDGQPRDGADRRRLPSTPGQAVRLLRALERGHGVPGCGCLPGERGQQPRGGLRAGRPADGAGCPTAAGYPVMGIGQNAAQAFTPYRITINGGDGRHHRRHPGDRLRPPDGVDGHHHPARPGLGLRRGRPGPRGRGGAADSDTVIVFLHWGGSSTPAPTRAGAAGQRAGAGRRRHHRRQPRPRAARRGLPGLGLRRLRARRLRLLQRPAAHRSERLAGHHGHRTARRQRDLAPGDHRGRAAPTVDRGRRRPRPPELVAARPAPRAPHHRERALATPTSEMSPAQRRPSPQLSGDSG